VKYEELQRYLEAKNMPVPRVHTSSAKIIKFLFYLRHGGSAMVKSTTSTFKTEMMPTEG